jgi:cutinase
MRVDCSVKIGGVHSDLVRRWGRRGMLLVGSAVLAVAGIVAPTTMPAGGTSPVASAQSCPQTELIFARGRTEEPGAGVIGNALISALRNKTDRNVSLYTVD